MYIHISISMYLSISMCIIIYIYIHIIYIYIYTLKLGYNKPVVSVKGYRDSLFSGSWLRLDSACRHVWKSVWVACKIELEITWVSPCLELQVEFCLDLQQFLPIWNTTIPYPPHHSILTAFPCGFWVVLCMYPSFIRHFPMKTWVNTST